MVLLEIRKEGGIHQKYIAAKVVMLHISQFKQSASFTQET